MQRWESVSRGQGSKCQAEVAAAWLCCSSGPCVWAHAAGFILWTTSDREPATERRAERWPSCWGGCWGTDRPSSSCRSTGASPTTAWTCASSGPPKTTRSSPQAAPGWPWPPGFIIIWSIFATATFPGPGISWICPDLCQSSPASCASAPRTGQWPAPSSQRFLQAYKRPARDPFNAPSPYKGWCQSPLWLSHLVRPCVQTVSSSRFIFMSETTNWHFLTSHTANNRRKESVCAFPHRHRISCNAFRPPELEVWATSATWIESLFWTWYKKKYNHIEKKETNKQNKRKTKKPQLKKTCILKEFLF